MWLETHMTFPSCPAHELCIPIAAMARWLHLTRNEGLAQGQAVWDWQSLQNGSRRLLCSTSLEWDQHPSPICSPSPGLQITRTTGSCYWSSWTPALSLSPSFWEQTHRMQWLPWFWVLPTQQWAWTGLGSMNVGKPLWPNYWRSTHTIQHNIDIITSGENCLLHSLIPLFFNCTHDLSSYGICQDLWKKWEYKNEKTWSFPGGFILEGEVQCLALDWVLSSPLCYGPQRPAIPPPHLLTLELPPPSLFLEGLCGAGHWNRTIGLSQAHWGLQRPMHGFYCWFYRKTGMGRAV